MGPSRRTFLKQAGLAGTAVLAGAGGVMGGARMAAAR